MNFARFIPETPDADFMRQQVGERGILEKIDAVNETIKRCLGEDHPVSVISNFYKMINDIEHSLNQNMNDPRAKKLVNTFDEVPETPKIEMKKETPKPEAPETPEKPDTTDSNEDAGTVDPAENTGTTDPVEGGDTDTTDNPANEGIQETTGEGDNPESEGTQETEGISEGVSEGTQEFTGPDTTEPEPTEPETKHPTRRGRKKSEGAE